LTDVTTQHGGRLESLDTLRGIAILMVIAFHVSIHFPPVAWVGSLAKLGNQGVQLFFLISAITMCFMWQQRATEAQRPLKFYIRRFFRIAPLFWVAICFYVLWEATRDVPRPADVLGWKQIVLTALFLHGFEPSSINTVVPGGWSIAVEMSFYAVFPLLAARRASALQMLVFALAAYLVLGVGVTAFAERSLALDPLFVYYSLLTQFPIFPVGMFVYAVAMRGERCNPWHVAAVAAAWLGVAFVGKYVFELNTRPFFWLQVALFALLIYVMIRRGIHTAALSLMGTLSYSMYLFHFAIIDVFAMFTPPEWRDGTLSYVSFLALVLVATTAAAKMSGVTLERWSSDLARAVITRMGRSNARRLTAE
jgi:peptidoglycan/LPS O-acetylase OafA/YrhL